MGGDVVSLEVEGNTAALEEALRGLDWIKKIKIHEDVFSLTMERGERRIPELIQTAQGLGVMVNCVRHRKAEPGRRFPPLHRTDDPGRERRPTAPWAAGDGDGDQCHRDLRPLAPGTETDHAGEIAHRRGPGHASLLPGLSGPRVQTDGRPRHVRRRRVHPLPGPGHHRHGPALLVDPGGACPSSGTRSSAS